MEYDLRTEPLTHEGFVEKYAERFDQDTNTVTEYFNYLNVNKDHHHYGEHKSMEHYFLSQLIIRPGKILEMFVEHCAKNKLEILESETTIE